MKKVKIIIAVIFFLLCMEVLFIPYSKILPESYYNNLHGSYLCQERPLESMTLTSEDNHFIYYYIDKFDNAQKADEGTYSKIKNGEFVIQSGIFKDTHVTVENSSFYIDIDGVDYLFKWEGIPTFLEIYP